ncbi:methyltransferase, FxLD system [Nocardioides speluncae]|uniref:methyltransferase, FxLD system n=1 Tax=Nocardioides speluncae TaxID=2670337 RepID=UPI000D68EB94|nr:methyltransferase, FxLD system [Nocardioides speluncae]
MNSIASANPEALRDTMVDTILNAEHARTPAVERAMRTVPRHRFVPDATVEDAYADIAVITKQTDDGTALSCASVPTTVAMMLDQLDVQPGHRVLEIGAGTGYNAALLRVLAGPGGSVTTVDIDAEVTRRARAALDATGNPDIEVITRDGALGAEENAPYDRIIFTVGAWDIPPAMWQQLTPGGRLVLPLRWRGQTRSLALVRDGERLVAESVELCGFVPLVGQEGELTGTIDNDGLVSLHWDADQPIQAAALAGVLDQPRLEAWSGVTVDPEEPFDGLWLLMTATEPRTCRIAAQPAAVESGLCLPAIASRSPAIVDGDSLAYFTFRRPGAPDGASRPELGAIGHGPRGDVLAETLCTEIRRWNQDRAAQPKITAILRAAGERQQTAGSVIDKAETSLLLVTT